MFDHSKLNHWLKLKQPRLSTYLDKTWSGCGLNQKWVKSLDHFANTVSAALKCICLTFFIWLCYVGCILF